MYLELISSIGVRCVLPRKGTGKACVAWRATRKERQRSQRPFWEEPAGSSLFGRIAALRSRAKTPSLGPASRLALHPKQGKLALTPIDETSSNCYTDRFIYHCRNCKSQYFFTDRRYPQMDKRPMRAPGVCVSDGSGVIRLLSSDSPA